MVSVFHSYHGASRATFASNTCQLKTSFDKSPLSFEGLFLFFKICGTCKELESTALDSFLHHSIETDNPHIGRDQFHPPMDIFYNGGRRPRSINVIIPGRGERVLVPQPNIGVAMLVNPRSRHRRRPYYRRRPRRYWDDWDDWDDSSSCSSLDSDTSS